MAESYAGGTAWTRPIWDVTAVAWLLNEDDCFMDSRITDTTLPTYENVYENRCGGEQMRYVYFIKRDALMMGLFQKLIG